MDRENTSRIPPERESLIKEQADGIVAFETRLANITTPAEKRRGRNDENRNALKGRPKN